MSAVYNKIKLTRKVIMTLKEIEALELAEYLAKEAEQEETYKGYCYECEHYVCHCVEYKLTK